MDQKKAAAAIEILKALASTIHESGPQGVPSGHLYASIMGTLDLQAYQRAIDILVRQGLVRESGHVLTSLIPRDGLLIDL